MTADLNGKPIPLKEVGNWYCEDFDAPAIHCFSDPGALNARVSSTLEAAAAGTAVNYVIVYDFSGFAGIYMYMSQDYTALFTIGWNDRVSSFIALNSQAGTFYQDWFYGGSPYGFCCNQQVSYLGSLDNTFSSVHRN